MKKISGILFCVALLTNILFAQKLTIAVSKNRVAVAEPFQIQFSLSGAGQIKIPNMSDFDVFQGPYQSSSTSWVNGVVTQSTSFTYVIAAKREGKFTVGPATASTSNGNVQSNAIVIEALKGTTNPNTQGNPNGQQSASSPDENGGSEVFVRTIVSKTKAYQGEEITVSHKVYSRYQLRGFQNIKLPSYDGFWSQDVTVPNQQIQVTTETIDGVNYQVAEIKRSVIVPQHSGKLQIDPVEASVVVRKQSSRRPRDIFEQMLGGGYEDAAYESKSKTIFIDVEPLPEKGKPANFTGAVGDYSYKVVLSKDKVKANDAVNLTITLSGRGNIKLVEAPKPGFPEDFETYDPKVKENISAGAAGVSGSKTFDYLLIPRHEGDYTINNLDFTFFNPSKNEYVTIPSPELAIHVDKGDASSASANVYSPAAKQEVNTLGNDIRYIKTKNVKFRPRDDFFFGSPLFFAGLISPFLAFFLFLFFRRKNIEENKDAVAVKSRKATKMAKKRLSSAEQHLRSGNKEQFYLEVSQALYGYISDKLNIAGADLSRENIIRLLRNSSVSEPVVMQLISALDTCEYARYAPSAVSGDLNAIYNQTVELITKIEHEIR